MVEEEEVGQAGCLISRLMLQLGFAAAVNNQKKVSIRKIESSVLQEKQSLWAGKPTRFGS